MIRTASDPAGNLSSSSAITGADSWVDVKGNNWTISGNTGQRSPADGFQTHQVYDGWGRGNTFTGTLTEQGVFEGERDTLVTKCPSKFKAKD